MVLEENLDISSLKTISSDTVNDRNHLTGGKRSRSFAANDGNDRNDGISSERHHAEQEAHKKRPMQRSDNSKIESKQSQGKDKHQEAQKDEVK